MCKVYEFPTKKELSEEMMARIDKVTEEYVEIMAETLDNLYNGEPTLSDYNEFMELMITSYLVSLEKAINKLV